MIDVILGVTILVLLGLVYGAYRIITAKPTHEDKLDVRQAVSLRAQLNHANALLTEVEIIDSVMPMLPAEFKTKLTNYLRGNTP